jgi:hypothetical protein
MSLFLVQNDLKTVVYMIFKSVLYTPLFVFFFPDSDLLD